jgi:ABC-type sulfate transport system permease component
VPFIGTKIVRALRRKDKTLAVKVALCSILLSLCLLEGFLLAFTYGFNDYAGTAVIAGKHMKNDYTPNKDALLYKLCADE